MDEQTFIDAIHKDRDNDSLRLIYADWLDERADPRAEYLRVQLAVAKLSIDHPVRAHVDETFAMYCSMLDPGWLRSVNLPQAQLGSGECKCYGKSWGLHDAHVKLHGEVQDTRCVAWQKLVWTIDDAALLGVTRFSPLADMSKDEREQIVSLPSSIEKLTELEELNLYGSRLRSVPVEICRLKKLTKFDPYTSYALHWFPYEYANCGNLVDSTISTRALFGNYKSRAAFPELRPWDQMPKVSDAFRGLYEQHWAELSARPCSVCNREFEDKQRFRYWISLVVATDVVPMLVNACSQSCVDSLPKGAKGYIERPHKGGPEIVQPDRDSFYA